jgi:hypothetical protein
MISWTHTRHVWSVEAPVLNADLALVSEGQALVNCIEGGIPKVKRATGSTSERLAGISMAPRRSFNQANKVDTLVVPAGGGTLLLTKTVTGNVGVFNVSTLAQIAASSSAASSTNIQTSTDSVTGLTALTFDASMAGLTVTATYSYVTTPNEEMGLNGNPYPGIAPSDQLGQIGVFKIGTIWVNNFDPAANWYAAGTAAVKVVAGGIFTNSDNSATGFVPTNVDVIKYPTSGQPWLGLNIH